MANFNLWERWMSIHVRNMSNNNPEDTPFQVWNDVYRWSYYIDDIKDIEDWWINILFQNLHCTFNALASITPNNYEKNITFRYKYDEWLNCELEIEPKNMEEYIKVSIQKNDPVHDISLNDLYIWHYLTIFIFWLMFTIWMGIKYIDKKWLLISKKNR